MQMHENNNKSIELALICKAISAIYFQKKGNKDSSLQSGCTQSWLYNKLKHAVVILRLEKIWVQLRSE